MLNFKSLPIVILIFVHNSICHRRSIHEAVEELKNLSKLMYGDVGKEYQQFMTQSVNDLLYPNGDKQKLMLLSSLWRNYYDCTVRSLDNLTRHRQVPSMMIMAYVGAVARLPCSVCIAPDESHILKWLYAESTSNMTFNQMPENERMVEGINLTIYNVKAEDAGVYRCEVGDSRSMVVLEVVDNEDYNVVKPSTSRGPYAAPHLSMESGLKVYTSWSPWSECSTCGKVGRRHRYGMCYVKLDQKVKSKRKDKDIILDKNEIDLFEALPGGLPCKSLYLPLKLREVDSIRKRPNEIMIAMCKVPCNVMIYCSRSVYGEVLEEANNTAGIYSLSQVLPKQPPIPVRDIIFADFGQWIAIRCPGTTLRDIPITWRFGTKVIVPRELDEATGGRVFINSRDHLVITRVFYRDANLYSCWQHDALAGTVRLQISARALPCGAALLTLLVAALVLLRLTERAARPIQNRSATHL